MLRQVLDRLIDSADDKAVQVQIVSKGTVYAGAIRRSVEHAGVYEVMTPMNRKSGAVALVVVYLTADGIDSIMVEAEAPKVISPAGGLVIPRKE